MINTTLQGDGYKKQMSMPHCVIPGTMLIMSNSQYSNLIVRLYILNIL